jgi:hypothetical protein
LYVGGGYAVSTDHDDVRAMGEERCKQLVMCGGASL